MTIRVGHAQAWAVGCLCSTVLPPPGRRAGTDDGPWRGAIVRQERLAVSYEARGPRRTNCGGDAQALLLVPAG